MLLNAQFRFGIFDVSIKKREIGSEISAKNYIEPEVSCKKFVFSDGKN
jgi:hypothetical protein